MTRSQYTQDFSDVLTKPRHNGNVARIVIDTKALILALLVVLNHLE